MYKELDLVKILEKVPKGTKLYSTINGEVAFTDIRDSSKYPIAVTDTFKDTYIFTKEGKYITNLGECVLFPSKECRDWNEFKVDLPKGTPVMVSDDKSDWKLRFYYRDKRTYNAGYKYGDTTPWGYIIPVDKFDCNNLTFDIKDNYGMAVR